MTRTELFKRVGNISQIAGIKSYNLNEGKAAGTKAFDVFTGSGLEFTVLESKCLDILSLKYKGVNLSFLAKPGLVSPAFFNPHGSEFHRNFQGGALYTCGLSNVGSACTDNGVEYCMHGRIGSIPADKVYTVSKWDGDEYLLEIGGEMREAALFNENLVLGRRISTGLGSKIIRISDEVENQGFEEQAFMLLYHFNFGYPLLDDGAELVLPVKEVVPRDEDAKKGLDSYSSFHQPVDGYREQAFYHSMSADSDGSTFAAVINRKLDLGVYIKINLNQLPRLIEWKCMMSGDYALGIEPANCLVEGRARERELRGLKNLAPMEKACFDLEIGVLDGSQEINELVKRAGLVE